MLSRPATGQVRLGPPPSDTSSCSLSRFSLHRISTHQRYYARARVCVCAQVCNAATCTKATLVRAIKTERDRESRRGESSEILRLSTFFEMFTSSLSLPPHASGRTRERSKELRTLESRRLGAQWPMGKRQGRAVKPGPRTAPMNAPGPPDAQTHA